MIFYQRCFCIILSVPYHHKCCKCSEPKLLDVCPKKEENEHKNQEIKKTVAQIYIRTRNKFKFIIIYFIWNDLLCEYVCITKHNTTKYNTKLLFSFCWFGFFLEYMCNNIPLACTYKPFRHTANQMEQLKISIWPVNMSELNMNFSHSLLTAKFHWLHDFVFIWTHVH